MSDQEVSQLAPLKVRFPDGTSRVFTGTEDDVSRQAKAYWQKSHPAPRTPTPVPAPPAISRTAIDAYRLQHFNSNDPDSDINLKMAHAFAANPKDPNYLHRYAKLEPVAQRAISEKADEIQQSNRFSLVLPEMNPDLAPFNMDPKTGETTSLPKPSKILAELIHGPEGAKRLDSAKGFGAEAERLALGSLDPENVLAMYAGGALASQGIWASRAVTAGFAGLMGKGAYDKMRAGDPGGAFADLSLAGAAVGGHALAEKLFAKGPKLREPPPPNPTTAQVHEPSGLGPGPASPKEPSGLGAGPKPEPPPEPPKTETEPPKPTPEPPKEPPKTGPTQEEQDAAANERARAANERARERAKAEQEGRPRPESPDPEEQAQDRARDNARAQERAQQERAEEKARAAGERAKARQSTKDQSWGRQPGEPAPPPRSAGAAAWDAYRQEHYFWRRQDPYTRPYAKNQRETYAQWKAARDRFTSSRQRSGGPNYRQQRRPDTPPPRAEPPYTPVDPDTPHPEVDKFKAQANTFEPNIGETSDIVAAKTRLAQLVARNKLTMGEKAERVRLDNKINTHISALQSFVARFKAATGRDPGIKVGTWSDKTSPSGRTEVIDKIRQVLRSGGTTYEKMFPESGFKTSAIVSEQQSTDVSRETSALEGSKNAQEITNRSTEQQGVLGPAGASGEGNAQFAEDPLSSSKGGRNAGVVRGGSDAGASSAPKAARAKHRGIVSQLGVPEPKAIFRATSRNLYINPAAESIIRGVMGSSAGTAWTVAPKTPGPRELAQALESTGRYINGYKVPPEGAGLAAEIRNAAANTPGGSVIFHPYSPAPKGFRDTYSRRRRITLHENVHVGQEAVQGAMSSLTPGVDSTMLTGAQQAHLASLPGWDKGAKWLKGHEYSDSHVFVEMPAYLSTGDHARLGVSDEEKDDILRHYFRHLYDNYGRDAVATVTARTTGTAKEVGKLTGGMALGKVPRPPAPETASKEGFNIHDIVSPLPPKAGFGPVGRVAHHGVEVLNDTNKTDAARVSGPVRAEMMTRDMFDGLTEGEKDLLGEWLVGNRLYGDSVDPTKSAGDRAAAEAHPRWLDAPELARIASNPHIKDAIDKWQALHLPVLDDISRRAGVSAAAIAAKPHYFPLINPDFIRADSRVAGASDSGGYASWESKARPQSSTRRHKAKYTSTDYSTDVGGVLRTVLRTDEPKAALNDLWRTLHAQGLIVTQPSGAAGRGWTKPEGYVGDEIAGKFSSMPADLVALYGGRGKVYLPQDIVQTMDEINKPKMFSGSRGMEIAGRISRALISTTLGLNVPAAPFHIYRQTAMFRASTAYADAKRNPATVLVSSIPVVGTLVKGAVIASRDADDPVYREVYRHLVEINAISPRSMEGLTGNLGRLPLAERWSAYLHDSMFGVPHGKGVNGWAGRIAVEAYLARSRFEQTDDPEGDRRWINGFGAYTRRLAPMLGALSEMNPFTRTHFPRIITSLKLSVGDTGLKTPRRPGESETTFKMREAADRIGAFALAVALPVVGLVVLNKVLSGKYPWENGKGHELDLNLGHGHFVPIGRLVTELQPTLELSGIAARMHRTRGQRGQVMSSGMPTLGGSKMSMGNQSSPFLEAAQDIAIGAGNTALGMGDSPALNAGAALVNRRMYLTYDNHKKTPDLMSLSPSSADAAEKAINTVAAITGASTIIPTQGYSDDGQYNIGRSILDYLTQGAVKTDHPRGKGMTATKLKRR